jgi:hypothetical protein
MFDFHQATSLFLPAVLRIESHELLRSPRKYTVLIALALVGDVIVTCAVPLGVITVLLACGTLGTISTIVASASVVVAAITIKLGRLDYLSEVHSTMLWGGTLYVFNDGWSKLGATSCVGVTQHTSIRQVFAVDVPGLALWSTPMMREFKPTFRRVGTPMSFATLSRTLIPNNLGI